MSEQERKDKAPARHAVAGVADKPKRQLSLGVVLAVVALTAAVSFIAGARGNELANLVRGGQNADLPAKLDYSELDAVYSTLRNNYDGQLSTQELLDGAKKGLVEASGDPYSEYFTDTEANQFFSDLDGEFSGIGAELGIKEDILTIISTIDGSPAQKAGLRAGDAIGLVNEEDTSSWSIDEAVSNIRGEKGTTVKLTIRRGDEVKEINVVRDDIVNPSVRQEILDGNIGYLRLSRFNDTDTLRLSEAAARDFKQRGVKGVILDMRGNGGGYVTAAQEIAGLWLDSSKTVVEERQGSKVIENLKATGDPVLKGVPTIVLVDNYSASASEIVAGALKDHGAARLVGEQTYGKGSVQTIKDVIGGGQLKVTVAKWYTPNGKNIDGEGIAPDVEVSLSEEDFEADRDPQRDRALELLK